MNKIIKRISSILLIAVFCFVMIGSAGLEPSYAATKSIHVKKANVYLWSGKQYTQTVVNHGKKVNAKKVKWKSSDKTIATINKTGKIKAKSTGCVKMTAKYKGKSYDFSVLVCEPYSITAKNSQMSMANNTTKKYRFFMGKQLAKTGVSYEIEDSRICKWDFCMHSPDDGIGVISITATKDGTTVLRFVDNNTKAVYYETTIVVGTGKNESFIKPVNGNSFYITSEISEPIILNLSNDIKSIVMSGGTGIVVPGNTWTIRDNTAILTLHALRNGSTSVTFYDPNDPSVCCTIQCKVKLNNNQPGDNPGGDDPYNPNDPGGNVTPGTSKSEAIAAENKRHYDELDSIDSTYSYQIDFARDMMETLMNYAGVRYLESSSYYQREMASLNQELSNKRTQLALLKRDTSGSNALKIMQLEREISELEDEYMSMSYANNAVPYKEDLDRLQREYDSAIAAENREHQRRLDDINARY